MDLIFFIVLGIIIYHIYMSYRVENMTDTSNVSEQIKQAVKEVYLADVEAIRNLSEVATKLQAGGLTVPGTQFILEKLSVGPNDNKTVQPFEKLHIEDIGDVHMGLKTKGDDAKNIYLINRDGHFRVHQHGVGDMFGINHDGHTYIRSTQDHGLHIQSDGNSPYITLSKTNDFNKKAIYIQNTNAHTEDPIFNVSVHGGVPLMHMSPVGGVRWYRKDGRWTHFDHNDGKNYIRGDTIIDGNLSVQGNLSIGGRSNLVSVYSNKIAISCDTCNTVTHNRNYPNPTNLAIQVTAERNNSGDNFTVVLCRNTITANSFQVNLVRLNAGCGSDRGAMLHYTIFEYF